jgi:hypothetical protein
MQLLGPVPVKPSSFSDRYGSEKTNPKGVSNSATSSPFLPEVQARSFYRSLFLYIGPKNPLHTRT